VSAPTRAQAQSTQQAKNATLTVTGAVSWRRPGLKYSKNEVFLDIVEEVNLLMSSTGVHTRPVCWQTARFSTQVVSSYVTRPGLWVQKQHAEQTGARHARQGAMQDVHMCADMRRAVCCGWAYPRTGRLSCGAGAVLRNDVVGRIMMKCLLSDMPELRLGLNEKIEDITFHQVSSAQPRMGVYIWLFQSCASLPVQCCSELLLGKALCVLCMKLRAVLFIAGNALSCSWAVSILLQSRMDARPAPTTTSAALPACLLCPCLHTVCQLGDV
jgi:hypothetical protein